MIRLPLPAALLLASILMVGCTGIQDVLEPSAVAADPPAAEPFAAEGDAGDETASTPAVPARTRLRFDPIVGAGIEAVTPLTERLAARARSRGIGLAGSTDPSATHVLKGYFSTIAAGSDTTIIYVWDVYDPDGNRLHRISGQQKAAGGAGTWNAISPETMQQIADLTIEQLAAWLGGRTG